uniref:Uncharacterized protein n=1 Tax=Octopus bimaculoides TaxID=37653 RepID=A0A0L8FUK9_OCTBM
MHTHTCTHTFHCKILKLAFAPSIELSITEQFSKYDIGMLFVQTFRMEHHLLYFDQEYLRRLIRPS